jgi:hypothetical protein
MAAMVRTISATLFLLVVLSACNGPAAWPKESFDAREWKETPESKRYVFAHDLVDRKLLNGKTLSEVTDLLGPPSSEKMSGNYLSYVVATGGIGFNQVFFLELRFDESGQRVEHVRIGGD